MRLTMKEKQAITRVTAGRYQQAAKQEKSAILDEFIRLTDHNRCYRSCLLSSAGKTLHLSAARSFKADLLPPAPEAGTRPDDDQVVAALLKVWMMMDQIRGKRPAASLPDLIPRREACGELHLATATKDKLLKISAATP